MSARYFALIALGLLFFGCTAQPTQKDVMLASLEKAGKLVSLSTELEMNVTSATQDGSTYATASISQKMSGKKIRADMKITGISALDGVELRSYTLENGSYICGKTDSWDCVQTNASRQFSGEAASGPAAFAETSRKLLNAGALEFIGAAQEKEIAGRMCTRISARINYTKASEVAPEIFPNGAKNALISQCLDAETGIALSGKLAIEEETQEGGVAASQFEFQVSQLSPNIQIPDDTFSHPT
ncbi:MAG: hypothetical protein V1909_05190 [Candidatus Micrarchaeota archaeon]